MKAEKTPSEELKTPIVDAFVNPFEDKTLNAYLRSVADWHGYVRFLGLSYIWDSPDLPINRLFVIPQVSRSYIRPEDADSAKDTHSIIDALQNNQYLLVLGDPGSGKSTLVNWIANSLTYSQDEVLPSALGGRLIPMPVVLRDMQLKEGDLTDWDTLLGRILQLDVYEPLRSYNLQPLLENGQLIFLFDGIDEIASVKTREQLRRVVQEGMSRYSGCYWLLTSRIIGHDEAPFDLDQKPKSPRNNIVGVEADAESFPDKDREDTHLLRPSRYYAAPFNAVRIRQFALNWYGLRDPSPSAAAKNAQEFLDAINANQGIKTLAAIPNLLTMMALVHRNTAHLPDGRAMLYEAITKAYLQAIDDFRKLRISHSPQTLQALPAGRDLQTAPWKYDDMVSWLSCVGYQMQLMRGDAEDTVLVEREQVVKWLSDAIKEFDYQDHQSQACQFLDYLARRSGLLIPRSENAYAFVHLSFLEFFAAKYLVTRICSPAWIRRDDEDIVSIEATFAESMWLEVWLLAFELLPAAWSKDVLQSVKRKAGTTVDILLARLISDDFNAIPLEEKRAAADHLVKSTKRRSNNRTVYLDYYSSLGNEQKKWVLPDISEYLSSMQSAWGYKITLKGGVDDLEFVKGLKELNELYIPDNPVADLSPLSALEKLAALNIRDTSVSDLSPLSSNVNLQRLEAGSTPVSDLSPISEIVNLKMLSVMNTTVSDLAPLSRYVNLQTLIVSGTSVSDLSPLFGLIKLQRLSVRETLVSDLSPISRHVNLQMLNVSRTSVSDLSPLSALVNMQELSVNHTAVSDLSTLSGLVNLQALNVSDTSISDLTPLSGLVNLQRLDAWKTSVSDLRPLSGFINLQALYMWKTPVSDLRPLSGLVNLQALYASNTSVSNLSPLSGLVSLQTLDVSRTDVSDLSPLSGLANLQELIVSRRRGLEEQVDLLKKSRPKLQVVYTREN